MRFFLKYIIKIFNWQILKCKVNSSKIKSIPPLNFKIGKFVVIDKNVEIEEGIESVGDGTFIGKGTYINHCKSIGKYCSIARNVGIGVGSHPLNRVYTSPLFYNSFRGLVKETTYDFKREDSKVVIGNDVWIGYNSVILNGVNIGDGAVVAAGAIVREDVEPYSIVGGVPARKIGMRFNENIAKKMVEKDISNLSIDIVYNNIEYICDVDRFIDKID